MTAGRIIGVLAVALLVERLTCAVQRVVFHKRTTYPSTGHRQDREDAHGERLRHPVSDLIMRRLTQGLKAEDTDNARTDNSDEVDEDDLDFDEGNEEDEPEELLEDSPAGDVHIHLKSLLDAEVVQYLLREVPWEDLFSGNKLSRTEEVRYITEHLLENEDENNRYDHRAYDAKGDSRLLWTDVTDLDSSVTGVRRNRRRQNGDFKPQSRWRRRRQRRRGRRPTRIIFYRDCPLYFHKEFGEDAARLGFRRVKRRRQWLQCQNERRFDRMLKEDGTGAKSSSRWWPYKTHKYRYWTSRSKPRRGRGSRPRRKRRLTRARIRKQNLYF